MSNCYLAQLLGDEIKTPDGCLGTHTPYISEIDGEIKIYFSAYTGTGVDKSYAIFEASPGYEAKKVCSAGMSMCAPWVTMVGRKKLMYATVMTNYGRYEAHVFEEVVGRRFWPMVKVLHLPVAHNVTSPCVIATGNGYTIFFTGSSKEKAALNGVVYRATSSNGLDFTNIEEVELPIGHEPSSGFFKPNVFNVGGRWLMFVSELDASGLWFATVYESKDLMAWRFIRHIKSTDRLYQFYKPVVHGNCMAVVRKFADNSTIVQLNEFNPDDFR